MIIFILWAAFVLLVGFYIWLKKSQKPVSDAAPQNAATETKNG
jgi:hypothetical protein